MLKIFQNSMFDFEKYINCSECPKEKSKDNIYLSNFKNLSSKGKIEFKKFFSIKYRKIVVLKNIILLINPNEKIEI